MADEAPDQSTLTALSRDAGLVRGAFNPRKRNLLTPPNAKVMLVPINDAGTTKYGMIDDWQAGFIERRLRLAESGKYDLVILEIDTNGGYVDSCERINRATANCKVPAVAYVVGKAFSGGALISLGCRAIVMAPGTQIGGAKAVGILGSLPADMRQKVDSEMRASVANLCDANDYPPVIAQGMVDSAIEVLETNLPAQRFMTDDQFEHAATPKPVIVRKWKSKDQILTLSANEARDVGLASGIAANADEVLLGFNVNAVSVERAEITASETAARFLSNPLWRVLLVLAGVVALFLELKSPGHGAGYLGFAFCIGVFFWLQIFSHNAGLLEIAMFGAGAVLLAVEFFVLPTVGALAFAGMGLVVVSIVLAFFPEGSLSGIWNAGPSRTPAWQMRQLVDSMMYASITLLLLIAFVITIWLKGASLPVFRRMALHAENPATVHSASALNAAPGSAAPERSPWIGQFAVTETVLRPSGKVRIGDVTIDATTEGAYLDAGVKVIVLRVSGNGAVVRGVSL